MEKQISRITENVWKAKAGSNIYYIDLGKNKVIIDTGERSKSNILRQFLDKVVDFDKINIVIFTHLHYDHVGNFDLFPNAQYYASKKEIEDFHNMPENTVLANDMAQKLSRINLHPAEYLNLEQLKIIQTPGHTRGSISIWYEPVLFTGDTLFGNGYGRSDLPTSSPSEFQETVIKLLEYNYKYLCPGHDY